MNQLNRIVLCFISLVPLLVVAEDDADILMKQRIDQQQAVSDRHRFDARRDIARKPYELFQFLGVRVGMTTFDVCAYACFSSELLAAALCPYFRFYSLNS